MNCFESPCDSCKADKAGAEQPDGPRYRYGRYFKTGIEGREIPRCQRQDKIYSDVCVYTAGIRYRTGTVPRDYLVGKAILVYWSDAFKPHENFMPVVPNIGRIEFIQGGSAKKL